MSLDNDIAYLDYKISRNGFDITIGSNYSFILEIPDYGTNLRISNTF